MEKLVMKPNDFWRGRRVLVTGHTGFKGAWLSFWLAERGAIVSALALAPTRQLALFDQLDLAKRVTSVIADINDRVALDDLLSSCRPEVVFHLAAQALVRPSYRDPVLTFSTNVLGTVQLLDALRVTDARSVVVVTSDKAYENREWFWGYRETDDLGGHDPYSASKGAAELAVRSMRRSYYAPYVEGGHPARIATVRAGNVIGGGDWAEERLVPDIVRSILDRNGTVELRNPASIRPWQHVLDPVAFYLELAERLFTSPDGMDEAWNVGPDSNDTHSVREVAEAMIDVLGRGRIISRAESEAPHEARLLALDCAKARAVLKWRPRWSFEQAIRHTAEWYAAWSRREDVAALSRRQIAEFDLQRQRSH